MGSAFWENFDAANQVAVDVMGEEVLLDGHSVTGVVDPQSYQEGAAVGGRKGILRCGILVTREVMDAVPPRDGMVVELRGLIGRVESWEPLGPMAGVLLNVGPYNRWSGEVPGV
jgi:hypothetical protein